MEPKIVIPDTERGEEEVVEVPVPDTTSVRPDGIVTTKRAVVKRSDSDQMTTDSGRFVEN